LKKLLVLFYLITSVAAVKAQSWGTLSAEDFRAIEIINAQYSQSMKLTDIADQPINGSWSQLSSLGLGSPTCTTSEYTGTECNIKKSGIEIYYSDQLGEFLMGELTITSASYGFKIKGHLIKVGDDISKLSSVNPEAYSKRKKVPSKVNEYQVLLHLDIGDVSIYFRYDQQTNCITKIGFFQSIV